MRCLFLISILIIPFLSFSQKKDYKNYDKAIEYFNKEDFVKAKQLISKCIDSNKNWEKPYQLLGKIYEDEGNIELAVENYYKGFDQNNPLDQLWWKKIADLYFENGIYKDALYHYNQFVVFNTKEKKIYKQANKHIKDCEFALIALKDTIEYNPKNMGENINSEMEEYLPFISANGKKFIVTRRIKGEIRNQEDFFLSEKDEDGNWKKVREMSNINTPFNEGAITISADGRFIVFTACDRDDSKGSCDLYISLFKNGKFTNMGSIINSENWESQGCFSPDGKYLYFISNRPGGFGDMDIWISELTENGFSQPFNAGSRINTEYNEMSPFLHADNLTLYFASNGHIGMGDYDIFVSRRSNSQQKWGIPENIGYPINTHLIENSLIVANDGKTAYFASDQSGFGMEDIFFFELPEKRRANKLSDLELEIITQKVGEEVILRNVHFAHNSFKLDENSFIELNELTIYLQKTPVTKIIIEGHTDNLGEKENNLILSQRRAKAVYDYLLTQNIQIERLSFKGFGENKPIADNKTSQGKARNRRTSFKIIQ